MRSGPPAVPVAYRESWGSGKTGLPGALGHARQLATVSHLTKAHAAQAELAVHGVRAATALAAGVATHAELGLASRLSDQSLLRHLAHASMKGKPRRRRSARPSASLVAVVTTVMSIPRTRSILSWSISWNMTCSVRPKV